MAKKYCKKSSVQTVADEIRVRGGFPDTYKIQGSYMATEISNLEKPVNRGSPSVTLTASIPSYTAQEGKYTGGSVSVVPQIATAQLSQNGGYVLIESGKTLASVKVPASPVKQIKEGTITSSANATSVSIDGLTFKPVGAIVALTGTGTTYSSPKITFVAYDNGSVYGNVVSSTYGGAMITSVSATITDTSITLSNIVAKDGSTTYNGNFVGGQYVYFVWG